MTCDARRCHARRRDNRAFARVEILPRAKSEVLLVPRDAVRREDGRTTVLAVRDGRAVAVPVSLGDVSEETVEVVHGLRVDDEIVVGEGARKDSGELIAPSVKKGDRILFGKWSGTEVKIDGKELLIMKESDIMGIID